MYLPVSVACERCEDAVRGFRIRVGGFLMEQEVLRVSLIVTGVMLLLNLTINNLNFSHAVIYPLRKLIMLAFCANQEVLLNSSRRPFYVLQK